MYDDLHTENMMKYEAVLFDMDGTVLDTLSDLADSVNHTLAVYGMPSRTINEVRAFVGNGIARLIELSVVPGTSPELCREMMTYYKAYYDAHCNQKTRPYDGIVRLMQMLRDQGVKTAIVSNKPDSAVQELVRAYFPGLIMTAVGERADVRRKPAPDMAFAALEALGVDKSRAVYIGDTEVDAATARNAGMDCIGVSWGFRDRSVLEALDFTAIVDSTAELSSVL